MVASHTSPAGDLAPNPGMCPDWEPIRLVCRPAQSTEPQQPGLTLDLLNNFLFLGCKHFLKSELLVGNIQLGLVFNSLWQYLLMVLFRPSIFKVIIDAVD